MSNHLSDYFTWEEVYFSATAERNGIDNRIPAQQLKNVQYAARKMDGVRIILGHPIHVNSWYRSLQLNRLLKSKDTSAHREGLAVDFISPLYGSPLDICKRLLQYKGTVNWNQLILEFSWVHIAFTASPEIQGKQEVLTLLPNGHYAVGLTDSKGVSHA